MSSAPNRGPEIEVVNPATGERVGSVSPTDPAGVAAAVGRAREAQAGWFDSGFRDRARVIARFHDLLTERQDEILDTIQNETGRTRRDALPEPLTVARTCQYYLANGRSFLADSRGAAAVPGLGRTRTTYKPHGVVGLVSPWNYPFILSVGDAIPALLAGNSVVIKPSELTPLSAELAIEMLRQAGMPEGVASLVHGTGAIGAELLGQVDYISFTGSSATGRKIAAAAGERLIPYSLELGGKNPLIVIEGAPLERAVDGFVAGAFYNGGQTCLAVERAFIQRSIYDRFVERAVERVGGLKQGWSRDWDLDMGSLISREHSNKVMAHVDDARAKGAQVLIGGERREDLGPAFVAPTLLADVDPSSVLYEEETFGPVVSLFPVADVDEAVARANQTPYGLNASVWGPDGATSFDIARRLETGSTTINAALMIYHCFGAPMGGIKQSGIGRRHGQIGILRFTQSQSIVSGPTMAGGYDNLLTAVHSPGRARWLTRIFNWRSKIPGLR